MKEKLDAQCSRGSMQHKLCFLLKPYERTNETSEGHIEETERALAGGIKGWPRAYILFKKRKVYIL